MNSIIIPQFAVPVETESSAANWMAVSFFRYEDGPKAESIYKSAATVLSLAGETGLTAALLEGGVEIFKGSQGAVLVTRKDGSAPEEVSQTLIQLMASISGIEVSPFGE